MTTSQTKNSHLDSTLLSDYLLHPSVFPNVEEIITSFQKQEFLNLSLRKRFRQINQTLYQLILDAPSPAFLLSAVLDFLNRINGEKILQEPLDFLTFEFWLNNFSNLTEQENYETRAKIVGKYIPGKNTKSFFLLEWERYIQDLILSLLIYPLMLIQ